MNTNNSTNIRKNSKSFLGMPIETRRSCLMKKTGHKKSRDTSPVQVTMYREDANTFRSGPVHYKF
jgi:hypothetical protein